MPWKSLLKNLLTVFSRTQFKLKRNVLCLSPFTFTDERNMITVYLFWSEIKAKLKDIEKIKDSLWKIEYGTFKIEIRRFKNKSTSSPCSQKLYSLETSKPIEISIFIWKLLLMNPIWNFNFWNRLTIFQRNW